MNDNLPPEGPAHAYALALLNDLMLVLANASKAGLERWDSNGDQCLCRCSMEFQLSLC